MVTVGVREFKAHLSHYLRLVQKGEEIAIQLRDQVVGYLSNTKSKDNKPGKERSKREMEKLLEEWKKEGFVLSGKIGVKLRPFKAVKMTPGPSISEIIRKIRDEED